MNYQFETSRKEKQEYQFETQAVLVLLEGVGGVKIPN